MATMSFSLRIAIADRDPRTLASLEKILGTLGHKVVAVARDGQALVKQCRQIEPDVVMIGPLTPELNGRDAAAAVYETQTIPIILYARQCDPDLVLDAEHKHVFMYLVEPILPEYLEVALNECHRSFVAMSEDDSENGATSNLVLSSSTTQSYRMPLRPPYRQLHR
jgi:AmiR/NasT family two-component response regulator